MNITEIADLNLWLHTNVFDGGKFVGLKKRGLWYRPDAKGYTDRVEEAGRYTPEEAKKHEYKGGGAWDEPVTIHEFPAEDFTSPAGFTKLLKKCIEKSDGYHIQFNDRHVSWGKDGTHAYGDTIEIALMLFAKKLFSNE